MWAWTPENMHFLKKKYFIEELLYMPGTVLHPRNREKISIANEACI